MKLVTVTTVLSMAVDITVSELQIETSASTVTVSSSIGTSRRAAHIA